MAKTVQNKPATVSNDLVDDTVNLVVKDATQKVFENVIRLEKVNHIAEDIAALMVSELRNASFMTVQIELTESQQEKLVEFVNRAVTSARDKYMGKLKKDERTKAVVEIVESSMKRVVEEALSGIGQEINRGAIISSTAVSANAKKEDFNSIELNYSKEAGDITIPTRGIFISTNCVKVIQDSCEVDLKEDKQPAITDKVDPETGEILDDSKE